MQRSELAHLVDHTLLKPEATNADVIAVCNEAMELATYSVCISPTFVELAKQTLATELK